MGGLYDYRWQKARKLFLATHPFCEDCESRGVVSDAVVVDHKIPHRGNLTLFWDKSNWQGLCKPCHDQHKQRLEKSGVVVGCNLDGIPADPNHHWNLHRKG